MRRSSGSGGGMAVLVAVVLTVGAPLSSPARAQAPCPVESEPNDREDQSPTVSGAACVAGDLPPGDEQDLIVWERGDVAGDTWSLELAGPPGILTRLAAYAVDSEPGERVRAGRQLLEVRVEPEATGPTVVPDLLVPARLLLGVSRSEPPGGDPMITDYRLELAPGARLSGQLEAEPNDDIESASAVEGPFVARGDAAGSDDVYRWLVPAEIPADGWRLDLRGTLGDGLRLALRDEEGRSVASASADDLGVASLRDLRLPPGRVVVQVTGGPREGSSDYLLSADADAGPGDAEPNDDPAVAAAAEVGDVTVGRITRVDDVDLFRVPPPETAIPTLMDVRLIWRSGLGRELCLVTEARKALQCRRATDGIALRNLLLPAEPLFLAVSGAPDPDDRYALRLDLTAAPTPGFESEPNDQPEVANVLPASGSVQGVGGPEDQDVFAFVAQGEAQLWRFDVEGAAIERAEWLRADGSAMGTAEVADDGASARLLDLYFVPGQEQLLRVRAGADYRVSLEPLGPADPDGEREPNDGRAFTETLGVGMTRRGRLPTATDVDEYRFVTTATDHLRVHVEAPPDGGIRLDLADDAALSTTYAVAPGETTELDLLLRTGDYRLIVRPLGPGQGRYTLHLGRDDRYVLAQDQEPNDTPSWASPLGGDGRVTGTLSGDRDRDWYRLPTLPTPAVVRIVAEVGVRSVDLATGAHSRLPLEEDREGRTWTSGPLEPGVPHYLEVRAEGDYALTVSGLGAAMERPPAPRLTLTTSGVTTEVAASWPAGQRVTGTLTIAGASEPVAVDSTASDARWRVVLQDQAPEPGPDGRAGIPFEVLVPTHAPADVPVRLSFRVHTPSGDWGSAWLDVMPVRDAAPVDPRRDWSVPASLLGGLDVASPAHGAVLLPSVDPAGEAALHDGHAPSDGGLVGSIPGFPLSLSVDLAGEEPVPVAGMILDALSADPSFGDAPRELALDLSLDGATWTQVIEGQLERTIRDQAFVLDEPVAARFARLRILSSHREDGRRISLGEWKVVAAPGVASPVEPIDLAESALGGHVAWTVPQLGRVEQALSMLDEDLEPLEPAFADPRSVLDWAVGFFEDRAARITALEWSDPLRSDQRLRFERLEVAVALEGPLGPWEPLGTWRLERAADGSVAPFVLERPTWARFVRFTSDATAKDARMMELPGALRILESPTANGYRSILGQWGGFERAGPMEAEMDVLPGIPDDGGDDSRELPRRLSPGVEVTGRVHHGSDTDWYVVTVPDDALTLSATVAGDTFVGTEVVVRGADGVALPLSFGSGDVPGTVRYEAPVEPNHEYLVEVVQPPASVVVTFDTSASVGPYLDAILGSLRGFARDVVPGRESVRILPFDGQPLLAGWNDQPFELEGAAATYVLRESSSGAEANLARAARDLAPRRGARAVLIVTDAASSSYRATAELWARLGAVRPLVFTVQTGGLNEAPAHVRHHLHADWAASAGGLHRYASSKAEIEEAFDHLATWLRRPAGYRLLVETSPEKLPPPERGTISVTSPQASSAEPAVVLAPNVAVGLVLDTSGSMLEPLRGGGRRIDAAKQVLIDLVGRQLPAGIPVSLRMFEDRARSCDTELAVPLGPLDPPAMAGIIRDREVPRSVRTPLAAAIEEVADDLALASGPRVVVVVSDGQESCGGDPVASVERLVASGLDVRLNIVGLGLARKDRRAMARLAERVGGRYFDAKGATELAAAMAAAVSARFTVLDESGRIVVEGSIGAPAVPVPSGIYRVVVDVVPEVRLDEVYVAPGAGVDLELPGPDRP